jgi:hypothetical protein
MIVSHLRYLPKFVVKGSVGDLCDLRLKIAPTFMLLAFWSLKRPLPLSSSLASGLNLFWTQIMVESLAQSIIIMQI